jgi:GNAT superfamily N-acetyltransferase
MLRRLQVILNNPGQIIFTWIFLKKDSRLHSCYAACVAGTRSMRRSRGLVINQVYRKKGLGKLLLSAAEKWAKDIVAVKSPAFQCDP